MLGLHRAYGRPSRVCEGISGYHMVWGLVILGLHVEALESGMNVTLGVRRIQDLPV